MAKKNAINNITKPVYDEIMSEIKPLEVSNIEQLTDADIDNLKVGDVVQKITGEQKHAYVVSYKQEKHGICLTYVAAGYTETISYDYVGGHWVFNSKDVVSIYDDVELEQDLKVDGDANLNGDVVIGGGLDVVGATTMTSDLTVLGDVEVKTISQEQANWSKDISSMTIDHGASFSSTITYGRFEVIGNVLYFVLCYKIRNITESTADLYGDFIAYVDLRDMPVNIAKAIYDCDGNTLYQGNANRRNIIGCIGTITEGNSLSSIARKNRPTLAFVNWDGTHNSSSNSSMQIRGGLAYDEKMSIPAGEERYIQYRTFLTLI